MKNSIIAYAFLSILFLSSCTKIAYTHQQVMQRYQTKQQVVTAFGLPDEKRTGEGIEEWRYYYGTVTTRANYGNSTTTTNVDNTNGITKNSNTNSVDRINHYDRFVKFTFQGDRVLRWDSQGVDKSERVKAPGRTAGVAALSAAALVGIYFMIKSVDDVGK